MTIEKSDTPLTDAPGATSRDSWGVGMAESLAHLLVAAAALAGGQHPCVVHGHKWESDAGRSCPINPDCGSSQAVYRCSVCGDWDYGYPGGPGHADCVLYCQTEGANG